MVLGCTFPYAAQGDIFNDTFPVSVEGVSQSGAEPVGVAFLFLPCTQIQVSSNVIRKERTDDPMNVMDTDSPIASPQL